MNITKKITGAMTGLLVAATIFGFVAMPTAQALSQADATALITALGLTGTQAAAVQALVTGGSENTSCETYGTSAIVRVGHTGENVKKVQRAMNQVRTLSNSSQPQLVVDGKFGPLTKIAVQEFQTIIGSTPDGINGPNTDAAYHTYVANHCDSEGTPEVTPGVGSASVSGVSLNGGSIATGGNANVFAFQIAAGSSALDINDITFTRYGNSVNSNWENIKVLDENGVALTSAGTLNSSNEVKLTFVSNVMIASGATKMFYLRAGVDSSATNGQSASFGIASLEDINFVGSPAAGGSFPVQGPSFSVLSLTIGAVSVTNDGSVSDSTPDVGDENVELNKFKISVGSTEDVVVEQIQVEKQGSASSDDLTNIELYDVTNNATIATVSGWDAQGLATFNNLNIAITKGNLRRFKVRADIVDGASLTLNADLTDGSDVRVQVKGSSYGYYITPTITGGWNGQGSSNQTIAAGALTIAKSSTTPATGAITAGTDRLISVVDIISTGEALQVSSFKVSFNLGTMTDSEISNIRIRNMATGELLGGPNDVSTTDYTANSTTYEATATFSDVFEVSVGTTKVGIYADISNDVSANDTIQAGVADADTDLTAKGLTSNDTVTAGPAAAVVNGNTLTVKAGSLTSTTLTTPGAQSVAVGAQDFVWANFDLSANNSGEAVEVTAMTIAAAIAGTAAYADLDNVELWADLNSSNSSRGDVFETKISDSKNISAATQAFTLTQVLTIAKDASVRVAVVGDLSAGSTAAGSNDTYTVDLDSLTASGADTGLTVSSTPSGAGQAMTSETSGTLVASVDSSSPSAGVILDAGQNGMETIAIFRLTSGDIENVELDSFVLTLGGTGTSTVADTYYFQAVDKNGNNLGSAVSVGNTGATATAYWNDGAVFVPKNDHIKVIVKAVTRDVANTLADNAHTLNAAVFATGDVDGTGLASGAAIASTGTGTSTFASLFQSYPTFEWLTLPNTTLANNAAHIVGKLKITANGDEDVTFQNADGNKIDFNAIVGRSDDTTVGSEVITVKKENGTVLDTTLNATNGTTGLALDFSSADLTIAAGGSETIYFYMNTADLEDDNDSIQLQLDSSSASSTALDFGINGANFANAVADILWRGDMMSSEYAQLNINPS